MSKHINYKVSSGSHAGYEVEIETGFACHVWRVRKKWTKDWEKKGGAPSWEEADWRARQAIGEILGANKS